MRNNPDPGLRDARYVHVAPPWADLGSSLRDWNKNRHEEPIRCPFNGCRLNTRRALAALIEQRQFELHMAQIALLLCAARQEKGLSLQQLSDLTGISRPALSRIESGDNKNPTLNTLLRVARALGKEIVVSLRDAA